MNQKYWLFCCCSFAKSWPYLRNSMYFTNCPSLLNITLTESMMLSAHLIRCCSFILLPSVFPSIRVFSSEAALVAGGQSNGASSSVFSTNIQGWFPLGLTSLTYVQSKGLSGVFSGITIWKYQFFGPQSSLQSNSNIHTWLLEKE